MSGLTFINDSPGDKRQAAKYGYSQAVVIGSTVKCSGQGGWDDDYNLEADNADLQVANAFKNVERVLASAGVENGWDAVYLMRTYHVGLEKTMKQVVETLKAKAPHKPLWTLLTVPVLAEEAMLIEIEVEAYKPESAKAP
jgi:enamine deaminase RidA (YjgF/YER057c/UK114 family)